MSTPDYPLMLKLLAEQIGGPSTVAPTPDEFEAMPVYFIAQPLQDDAVARLEAFMPAGGVGNTNRGIGIIDERGEWVERPPPPAEWQLSTMHLDGAKEGDPGTYDGIPYYDKDAATITTQPFDEAKPLGELKTHPTGKVAVFPAMSTGAGDRTLVGRSQLVFAANQVNGFRVVTCDKVHEGWATVSGQAEKRGKEVPPHPFKPLVEAWLKRPTEVRPFAPRQRGSLPRLANVTEAEAGKAMTLPLPTNDEKHGQLTLPGIPEPVEGYPSWLLNAFEHLVPNVKGRRYAPLALRLFVAVLLRLRNVDRDGRWHSMTFPVLQRNVKQPAGESLESMLYGEKGWSKWHSTEHQDRLLRALHELKRSAAVWLTRQDINASFEFFNVSGFVRGKGGAFVDGAVEFSVRVPRSAANGDRIDWGALRQYGVESSPLYCGYLSASAVIGATAHHGHGQTAEIGQHLVGEDGKALYHKGKPKRDNTALVPNDRGARLVRPYSSRELARFCGMDPDNRMDRSRAVDHFFRISEDGHIDLRQDGRLYRLFARRGS